MKTVIDKLTPKKKIGSKEIIINAEKLETRVAFLMDNRLEDYFVERATDERLVGSIFKGKIQNLEDGLQAAFVEIGLKKNAFIHYWDMIPEDTVRLEVEEGLSRSRPSKKKRYKPGEMKKLFPVGTEIIVQVTKGPIGTKGPRVTANLSIPGRYLVMMPQSNLKGVSRKIEDDKERERLKKILGRLPVPERIGFIIRTAGAGTRKTAFARDLRVLVETWKEIEETIKNKRTPCRLYQEPDLVERVVRDSLTEEIDRILVDSRERYEQIRETIAKVSRSSRRHVKLYDGDTPVFEYTDVERQIENAYKRKVWLPSGGYLIFDETEALVAIDINTGRHKGADNQEQAITEVNVESAEEIARQLRLRNIGGLIVIDFIDMKQRKNKNTIYKTLKEALNNDKAQTNILPISDLGLLEMTRQRAAQSIRSSSFIDCPYCKGRGTIKSGLSMSVEIQRHVAEVMRKQRSEKAETEIRVQVHPTVLERLRKEDEQLLIDLEEKHGAHMTFLADSHLHMEQFVITDNDNPNVVYYTHMEK